MLVPATAGINRETVGLDRIADLRARLDHNVGRLTSELVSRSTRLVDDHYKGRVSDGRYVYKSTSAVRTHIRKTREARERYLVSMEHLLAREFPALAKTLVAVAEALRKQHAAHVGDFDKETIQLLIKYDFVETSGGQLRFIGYGRALAKKLSNYKDNGRGVLVYSPLRKSKSEAKPHNSLSDMSA